MHVTYDIGIKIAENNGLSKQTPCGDLQRYQSASCIGIASAIQAFSRHTTHARFTRDGSDALENHLQIICGQVRKAICALIPPRKLVGLLLAGGYGRGEGGVLRTSAGDQPYNDLEFYIFVHGSTLLAERKFRHALHALGEQLAPAAKLEVEFKILSTTKLRRAMPAMFYYDLLMGHRWLVGDDSLLAGCEHHCEAGAIPLHEATRLLMNRCSGLLFSAERLARTPFTADDADFVGRNLAKAQLGFGDVILAVNGLYHWSCLERHRRLLDLRSTSTIPNLAALCCLHGAGVEFKLHPVRATTSQATLTNIHSELTALAQQLWLWLESLRLHVPFADTRDYICDSRNKCPEFPALRNRLVNAWNFGPTALLASQADHHPREQLLRSLALLLWEKEPERYLHIVPQLQRELHSAPPDFANLVAAYARLWHRFN
jgi:hypothetical protein